MLKFNVWPIILNALFPSAKEKKSEWQVFDSWENALAHSTGYNSDIIISKARAAMLKVKRGEAAYERDTVLFDRIQYSWPLLAGLLWIAARSKGALNVIDFGGSLGSTYFQNRKFLQGLPEVRWNVVEQKQFVVCGRQDFEDDRLKFYFDIESCLREQAPNAILFSGVLQYLEDPYGMIRQVCDHGMEYILFDRTSFSASGEDVITVQHVSKSIYEASIPCWFLSHDRFLSFFEQTYDLIEEFEGFDYADFPSSWRGFVFRLRNK